MTNIAPQATSPESIVVSGGIAASAGAPRFWSASGRYGASLIAVLLGGYLLMRTQLPIAMLQPAEATEIILSLVLQFVTAAAVLLAGALLAPATLARRLTAIIVIVAALGAHIIGSATVNIATPTLLVYTALPITTGAFIATAVWLIVRGRSWPTLSLLVAFAAVPFLIERLSYTGWTGIVRDEVVLATTAVIGIGLAWGAAAVDGRRAR
ncbi:MAG TPA: hypothetical protein VNJ54_21440 [Plantibacter sp.]|uniref:hypothetical protein n=1 Tax=unclassified Plantibacter TaxID=2624265 RepID=UPI002C3F5B0B|nr:hypothetical protein [Plantibacter sp.]